MAPPPPTHTHRLYSSPVVTVPNISNEPILNFAPGSKERNDVIEVRKEQAIQSS